MRVEHFGGRAIPVSHYRVEVHVRVRRPGDMCITAIHDISDPGKFWDVVRSATSAGFREGIALRSMYPNASGTRNLCLWEADTVDAVRGLVEPAIGEFSKNEYFEINTDLATGLPG
jgi:hypothetical protein